MRHNLRCTQCNLFVKADTPCRRCAAGEDTKPIPVVIDDETPIFDQLKRELGDPRSPMARVHAAIEGVFDKLRAIGVFI